METSKIVGLAAVATGAVMVVALAVLPERQLVRGDIFTESPHESKVAWLEDGGKVYRVPVVMRDGGRDYDEKTAAEAPCKRAPKDIVSESPHESKVAWLPDGTRVYRVPVRLRDGGAAYDEKSALEAPCKRRPRDAKDCNRTYTDIDGREVIEQAPELNRYHASQMSGADCEPVACSVWLGDDAEADEVRK